MKKLLKILELISKIIGILICSIFGFTVGFVPALYATTRPYIGKDLPVHINFAPAFIFGGFGAIFVALLFWDKFRKLITYENKK